ncbi:hypothetical protein STCU_06385 [Strigomonas culicis]|uniref:GRAM domain-containing protein n=1 Tax=Strigomonas culicis TaxID=28005 RepID=S9VG06_9TRYP|nr:hypothetical protein STCU_06385 [Strigomonas culicis]|eukprot:EPY25971.1 hypothetical protein STCU_06385 [Strigomonas culicis]
MRDLSRLSANLKASNELVSSLTGNFQTILASSKDPVKDVLESMKQLSAHFGHCTSIFVDCLADLQTMGEAMRPVVKASPETTAPLLFNLYNTFARQFTVYFSDVSSALNENMTLLKRGKNSFYKESASALPPTTAAAVPSRTPAVAVDAAISSAAVTDGDAAAENTEGDVAAAVTKRKKKKHVDGEEDATEREAKPAKKKKAPLEQEVAAEADGQTHLAAVPAPSGEASEDPEVAALQAAAAAGARKKAGLGARKLSAREYGGVASAAADPAMEPKLLYVTTTVEDALGPMVMGTRPNVFSPVDVMMSKKVAVQYYVKLLRPGSIAHLILKSYIRADEDVQADLLCEVLDTECVEMVPFESTLGEVVVANEKDLSKMPICAWRLGNSEDETHKFFTCYTLVERPPAMGPTALVQDCLVRDGKMEEVLHVISLVKDAPEYAMVTAYTARSAPVASKAAAILGFTHRGLTTVGQEDVPDSVVKRVVDTANEKPSALVMPASGSAQAMEAFQPTVQLASLDQPGPRTSNFNLGDVAGLAMRGGFEVLKAPLTVSRVVGGAVLDVTGATDALRSNMEASFKKNFPDIAATDELVETYSCAWQDGAALRQGFVYIGSHWVCFAGTIGSSKFTIEFDEIKDIRKTKSAKILENSIDIITHLNDHYNMTSFLQRDQAYNKLMQLWLKR